MEILNKIKEFFGRFDGNYFFADNADFNYGIYFLVFFILLLVGIILLRFLAPRYIERRDPRVPVIKASFWLVLSFAIIGLFLVFFRNEALPFLSKRIFMYLDLFFIFLTGTVVLLYSKIYLPKKIYTFRNQKRKEKWLPKKKK